MIIKQGKPVYKVYRGEKLVNSIYRGENLLFYGSPYNPEATAALEEAFPEQWKTIKEYGRMHTEIVPYVNKNPLCAAIWCCYVQDGLVFQMDCNYECTAAKWKDVRSTIEFVGNGSVVIQDGVPYFNGNANYNKSAFLFPFNSTTIEIVYNRDNNSTSVMFLDGSTNGQAVGIHNGSYIIGESSNNTMASMKTQYGELVTFSTAKTFLLKMNELWLEAVVTIGHHMVRQQ